MRACEAREKQCEGEKKERKYRMQYYAESGELESQSMVKQHLNSREQGKAAYVFSMPRGINGKEQMKRGKERQQPKELNTHNEEIKREQVKCTQ